MSDTSDQEWQERCAALRTLLKQMTEDYGACAVYDTVVDAWIAEYAGEIGEFGGFL